MATQQMCETCYGTDFELIDGLYFCAICQSQSQVVREVVADEEFQEDFRLNFATQIIDNTAVVGLTPVEIDKAESLSQFAIVEIYTIILKLQVQQLIRLGFPKCLKDATLYIWIKFLRTTGRAFGEKPQVTNAETFTVASTSTVAEVPKIDARLAALNLHTTISVIYMAILKCGLKLFFYEFYRLAADGVLPFLNVYEQLPERYQQPMIKNHLETRIWITLSSHYADCALIALSIEEKFLLRVDIEEAFSRMLFALNLPAALTRHLTYLYDVSKIRPMKYLETIRRNDSNKSNVERKCPEMKFLALIVLALKLIFCIDDEREYVLSKVAKKCDSENAFIFMLWLTQLKMRISVLKGERIEDVLDKRWIYADNFHYKNIINSFTLGYKFARSRPPVNKIDFSAIFREKTEIFFSERQTSDFRASPLFPLRNVADSIVFKNDVLPDNIDEFSYRLFYLDFTEKHLDFSNFDLRLQLPKKDEDEFMEEVPRTPRDSEAITVTDQLFPCRKYYQFYRSTIRESSHIPLKLEHLRQELFSKNFDDLIKIIAFVVNDRPFFVHLSLLCIEQQVFKNWRYVD